MRAVQLALLVVCLQVGSGLIMTSGLFAGSFYERTLTNLDLPENVSAITEEEQSQASINIMNVIWDTLAWGWIRYYFEPFYSNNVGVKNFIDAFILFLDGISSLIIGVAFLEFLRNRINVLGG